MNIVADENIPFVADCLSSIGNVKLIAGREITPSVVADADILLVRSITKVNQDLLDQSNVKFVATATIGLEHIDVDYLEQNNIGFASAPGSNANSVGEYIIAALLTVAQKNKIELAGRSIGIIGAGNVGTIVEKKVKAIGMTPLLNDPPLQRQTKHPKYLPLEQLFNCDFITMHTPLTREGIDRTYHLADDKFFSSLKQGSIFLNTSRGAVTDTVALKNAITTHRLGSAVLDVWENEPNIDLKLLRIVDLSTPHIAGYSYDGKIAGMIMIYNAACKHFGLEPKFKIDNFLPEPQVPSITIDPESDTEQNLLHRTVQQVYVINRDDFNTREIAMVPSQEQGAFFDSLRKNYPIRREFQNTTVILKQPSLSLQKKLQGIGFKVKNEQE